MMKYCGREFTDAELAGIRQLLAEDPMMTRWALSRLVCETLGWRKPDGGLKDMSCRVALLRMQDDGLVLLPPPRRKNGNGKRHVHRTQQADPQPPLSTPVDEFVDLRLELVADKRDSLLWNEYIDRYHYLGYQPLPGAQLRYFAHAEGRILALLGFGAAAWKTAPRDTFIGWTREKRASRLHLVVNNARFLVLPWVTSKNLASKLLGLAARRLPADWHLRYGYRPVILETFIEKQRFSGTCYKAANWLCLGDTQGRGKLDSDRLHALPIKSVWVYPLSHRFRASLTG
ncbi:MAG: hypothetical protein A3K19_17895 [Lentisphaerae bacterium RIFOXYB12_FULL_65_16]|nr:MAG: hypothetical protein A3K18_05710 [Lentisphaerae bacterium RIFOXYA12_64_32]OGV85997.1 MAG: hypothetical protein A3K19_17895 [Lentisphaerae bacterium RIFOXYB12_FULL_65_16]